MKLKPLFDRVVVKEITQEETTVGGIFLPTAAKEKQEIGDKVLYSKYAGSTFKIDGEELTIIKQSDILAVVED